MTSTRGESYLELSNTEEDMLDTVCSPVWNNVIVVVNANNAMELDWVDKYEQIGAVSLLLEQVQLASKHWARSSMVL